MTELEQNEDYILTVFPCAIEYGDYSGLDDHEVEQLEGWLMSGNWVYDYGDESEFTQCEITGMYGACVKVTRTLIG